MKFSDAARVLALAVSLCGLSASPGARAQSVAYLQQSNNDRVIALHRAGCLNPRHAGEVVLEYYGNHIVPKLDYRTGPPGAGDRVVPEPVEAWKKLLE